VMYEHFISLHMRIGLDHVNCTPSYCHLSTEFSLSLSVISDFQILFTFSISVRNLFLWLSCPLFYCSTITRSYNVVYWYWKFPSHDHVSSISCLSQVAIDIVQYAISIYKL
jgi:hypothetical protein